MPIYLVIPLTKTTELTDAAVTAAMEESDRYRLQGERGWLVRFEGTSKELSDVIGITSPDDTKKTATGSVLVTPISTYYGRGPTDMWEWLKTRIEK